MTSREQSFRTIRTLVPLFFALCVGSLGQTAAEAPVWNTDRPGQSDASTVVGKGRTQLETGLLFSGGDVPGGDRTSSSIGGALARVGYWERVELRIGWDGWIDERSDAPGADADGIGNVTFGTKISVAHEDGRRPETALVASLSLPTGDGDIAGDRVDPAFRFSMSHTLSETLSLAYNAGLAWETEERAGGDDATLSSYQYTLLLGVAHSDRLGSFVEFFGTAPASAGGTPANSIDGGVSYRIRDRVQLDLFTGFGLSDAADDWLVGTGVSVLFD